MKLPAPLSAIFYTFFFFSTLTLAAQPKEHICAQGKIRNRDKSATLSRNDIRRTEQYDVHHYKLDLEMDHTSVQVKGKVTMDARCRVATDTILLELFPDYSIDSVRLNGQAVNLLRRQSALLVPANLPAGAHFSLLVAYEGEAPNSSSNALSENGLSTGTSPSWGNSVTWTLSQPFAAYEWWPCKQSLRDKIDSVDIHITVPSACKAGSNGVLQQVVNLGNGKSRYEWKHRHPINYYLISVAIAEYIDYTIWAHPENSDSIRIQNYIYNNPGTLTNFKADIDETADFMVLFSKLFGPYPFADEKYGHSMAPFGGGMEHQTMTSQGTFNAGLTAHELAHQWFGNHVTCATWADLWVNEGFATYAEYIMLQNLYPSQAAGEMNTIHTSVMSQPGGSVWIADSTNSSRLFSSRLTYNKGAAFLHILRYLLDNDSLFFQGLRNYETKFADSTAIGLDVKRELELVSGKNLDTAFDEWYFGEGFPTYSARWNAVGNDFHIRVNQTVSVPGVTPFFTTPIQVRVSRQGRPDTSLRIPISGSVSPVIIQGIGPVTALQGGLDPNNWIPNRVGTVSRDVNLVLTSVASTFGAENPFQVYPNPGRDQIQVRTQTEEKGKLAVYNVRGQQIAEWAVQPGTWVDVQSLPDGFYLLEWRTESGNRFRKSWVKQ